MSTFTKELCRTLRINQNISTAYHPQTDGQSKQTNQWLKQYLCIFTNFHQNDWSSWLPLAQYTHNAWPNATTKKAPFKLIMGHIPCVHQPNQATKSPTVEQRLQQVTETRRQALDSIRKAQELLTHSPSHFTPYQEGDQVWLEAKNLHTSHPSTKLAPQRYGPFPVTKAVSQTCFQLKLPPQWKVRPVFHTSLLTPYKETKEHGTNFPEPPPDLVDRQPEWEVEQILGARHRCNQMQYLIRWRGFSDAHDSWEPMTHINANQLIGDFYREHPSAIRKATVLKNHSQNDRTPIIWHITMSTTPPSTITSPFTREFTPLPPSPPHSLEERITDAPPPPLSDQTH